MLKSTKLTKKILIESLSLDPTLTKLNIDQSIVNSVNNLINHYNTTITSGSTLSNDNFAKILQIVSKTQRATNDAVLKIKSIDKDIGLFIANALFHIRGSAGSMEAERFFQDTNRKNAFINICNSPVNIPYPTGNCNFSNAIDSYDPRDEIYTEPYQSLPPLQAITKLVTDQKGYDINLCQKIMQYPLSVNKNYTHNKYAMELIYNLALGFLVYFREQILIHKDVYKKKFNLDSITDDKFSKLLQQSAGNERVTDTRGNVFKTAFVDFVNGKEI